MLEYKVNFAENDGRAEAYRTLEALLCGCLGEKGTELFLGLYKDENGKPCLPDESGLFVSISHTAHFGAAAIASSSVGIDVEEIAPLDEKKKALLERFFANEDISAAQTDPAGREFYRFWTRREAAFKAFAEVPFYSADPTAGNADKIMTYFQTAADREIVISVACAR